MRNVCYVVAVVVVATWLVGCSSLTWETRSYPLGVKPKAAQEIVDVITTEELKQHGDDILEQTDTGETSFVSKVIPEEDVIVVRTTPEGHRKIKAALQDLQE